MRPKIFSAASAAILLSLVSLDSAMPKAAVAPAFTAIRTEDADPMKAWS